MKKKISMHLSFENVFIEGMPELNAYSGFRGLFTIYVYNFSHFFEHPPKITITVLC